jgi:hypothetical protein
VTNHVDRSGGSQEYRGVEAITPEATMRRSIHTTVAVTAAVALAGAPAAVARPAQDFGPSDAAPQLTPAQLRAIDGHLPPDPPQSSPVEATPLKAPADGGGGVDPWVFAAIPVGLGAVVAARRATTRRPLRAHRRHGVSA